MVSLILSANSERAVVWLWPGSDDRALLSPGGGEPMKRGDKGWRVARGWGILRPWETAESDPIPPVCNAQVHIVFVTRNQVHMVLHAPATESDRMKVSPDCLIGLLLLLLLPLTDQHLNSARFLHFGRKGAFDWHSSSEHLGRTTPKFSFSPRSTSNRILQQKLAMIATHPIKLLWTQSVWSKYTEIPHPQASYCCIGKTVKRSVVCFVIGLALCPVPSSTTKRDVELSRKSPNWRLDYWKKKKHNFMMQCVRRARLNIKPSKWSCRLIGGDNLKTNRSVA